MLNLTINLSFTLLLIYCVLSVLYLFVLSFFGKFFYNKKYNEIGASKCIKKIAILVPAYKEDGIILSTAYNLLNLDYPAELYDIYIIADSFQADTLQQLRRLPLYLYEVSFNKSTKAKSLNEVFKKISKAYEIALICDADNMLSNDFLKKINYSFLNGAKAVQGRRVAKNLDTSFAILDSCSEAINNNIFRKGANAIGLSSSVIGSGMAFDYSLIKQIMTDIKAVGGFDKILQLKIVEQGIPIYYMEDALVFDEKVDSSPAFKQQRKRWISSQFIYLNLFFVQGFKQLFKGNVSYFNLAVANNIILPKAFMLIIFPVLGMLAFFIQPDFVIAIMCLWLVYISSLILALPTALINKELLYALNKLPNAIFVMLGTLFQLKNANNAFIHTVHTKKEISNPLYSDHGK